MPSGSAESPDDTFFNDLSQQAPEANGGDDSPTRRDSQECGKDGDAANKPKRIACILCRKRKLRCDGARPTCGTCKRLAHDCAYDEVRKKSGPKRGYVKLLEARLQQVETLLKNQESTDQTKDNTRTDSTTAYVQNTASQPLPNADTFMGGENTTMNFQEPGVSPGGDAFQANAAPTASAGEGDFPWEMIGLGLDEPLPPQDVINDLYTLYFTKIHPSLPIIHRPRFLAAMNLAPHMRPPVCLRYIMWTLAASVTDKYDGLQEHFYHRARKYAQMDEMKGHGESTITLGHCQTWVLVSTYEFKQMYFPRAWLSAGRAVRLAQMMQLHRLDGAGLDVKQCLPPPKDWTEREERRRTFWMSFAVDRYASIGTGWPMTIDERDIMTNLPASEEAFEKSKPMPTSSLDQAFGPQGASTLQPFGGIVLTAALFGRNLLHLHRPGPDDRDEDLDGGFWTRHRNIENVLLNTSLGLPDPLRLPSGLPDANVVFLNMSIHTSAICLHQAAIFKADKHRLPVNVSNESKIRCVTAAAEIASVMRMISHLDLSAMNPFIAFCVYVAARVFVQYLKTRPKDQQMTSSLQFLLQAMQALRRKNPLTESFLVQLDLDLEAAGVQGIASKPPTLHPDPNAPLASVPVGYDAIHCTPMTEIRETQSPNAPINQYANLRTNNDYNNLRAAVQADRANPNYAGNSPGPPFCSPNVRVDMDNQPSSGSQHGSHVNLPSRPASNADGYTRADNPDRFTPSGLGMARPGFNLQESQMDTSPDGSGDQASPATTASASQSRGGSTSHTSYSPAQQQDDSHSLPYRASPKTLSNQIPPPQSSSANSDPNSNTFFSSNDMFSQNFFDPSLNASGADTMGNSFMMSNDWDMTTGITSGQGMTPMSEGSWNQMLENITMGWEAAGPPHGAVIDEPSAAGTAYRRV